MSAVFINHSLSTIAVIYWQNLLPSNSKSEWHERLLNPRQQHCAWPIRTYTVDIIRELDMAPICSSGHSRYCNWKIPMEACLDNQTLMAYRLGKQIFFFQVNKDNLWVRYPVLIFLLINMLKWMQWTIVLSRKEQPVTLIWASEKSISSPTDDTRQCSRANSTSLKVMHGEPRQGG